MVIQGAWSAPSDLAGYGCEAWRFVGLGADMGLTIDDRIKTWTEGEWADAAGFPLAVINHDTGEKWGVRRLAEIVAERFPDLPKLIPHGCGYQRIKPRAAAG